MSIQIERRIRAAERTVAVSQPPERQPKVMFFPVGGSDQDIARYQEEVEQAVREGFFVIQIMPLQPKEPKK